MAAVGIVLVILSGIGSVVFSSELGVSFVVPKDVIVDKIEEVKCEHIISVKLDEKRNLLKRSQDTKDTLKLSKSSVKLFNSISSLIANQSTIEKKLVYMFPKSSAFITKFLESSNETESVSKNEDSSGLEEQMN